MTVRYRKWSGGDWAQLEVDGTLVDSGHSMPDFTWIALLRQAGVTVVEEEVVSEGCGNPGCPCSN